MSTRYDKEQLLTNARTLMRVSGGKVVVRGQGNERHVHFYASDGRTCSVWYPVESRVNDLEVKDLKDATAEMSGYRPASNLGASDKPEHKGTVRP